MNQKSRAISDVSNTGWIPANGYFSRINEISRHDPSYVNTIADPADQVFIVRLAALNWPVAGAQKLTVRLNKTTTGDAAVVISLFQGAGTLIASKTVLATTNFQDHTLNLPQDQVGTITDYTDLRLQVRVLGHPCPNSDVLTLNVPEVSDLPQFDDKFYTINLLANTDYFVRFSVLSGGSIGAGAFVNSFDSSGTWNFEFFLSDSIECGTLRKLTDFGLCIQVGPDSLSDMTFEIEVGTGPCP